MKKMKIKAPKQIVKNNTMVSWHAYNADQGGCGHIRVIFPTLLVNT